MSDESVKAALRSAAKLVVVEAPAGCGKTFQGADYAVEVASNLSGGRVLILAHTHAACDVFAARSRASAARVQTRTIDSLTNEIAAIYHLSLDLPADTSAWARNQKEGYPKLAAKVAGLLRSSPMIGRALVQRFPVVICDEHQDASTDQHSIVMALHGGGAALRIFGDPMQLIHGNKKGADSKEGHEGWEEIKKKAEVFDELNEPRRWSGEHSPLGKWILAARADLRGGGRVDLRKNLPPGVSVVFAENKSPKHGGYRLSTNERKPIDSLVSMNPSLLVLSSQNATVRSLRAFFNRRLAIWEGHVREGLSELVRKIQNQKGDPLSVTQSIIDFMDRVATGFSPSVFGKALLKEVASGCASKCRGKTARLQELGRLVLAEPDHKGAAKLLFALYELTSSDSVFGNVRIDNWREFWDAVHIGKFEDPDEGFAEISRRRSYLRPAPADKAISTIHKAKGLEFNNVVIVPCDSKHFGNNLYSRCCLYVAMSRAKHSLTFVVSRDNPSPLLQF